MLEGLKFLEQNGITHRDIKPANLFVKADRILKIGDFGMARFTSVSSRMVAGRDTTRYMAPAHRPGADVSSGKGEKKW